MDGRKLREEAKFGSNNTRTPRSFVRQSDQGAAQATPVHPPRNGALSPPLPADMTSSSPFTTSSAFLESCSTSDILTYTVATSATIDESAPRPVLAQPDDHALSSSTFFPSQQNTTGFILSRVVEDAFALELRWVAFSRSRGDEIETEEGQPGSSSNAFADLDKHPGTLPPVRFVFPARLVPGAVAAFALAPDGKHLEVYAVTEARYLYVLTFPLETLFYGADLAGEDAPEWSDEFKLESLEGRTPVLMKGIEDGRVVVACADGFVACMDFATGACLPPHFTE